MAPSPSLLWFRQDLRLLDNLALQEALGRGGPVLPVYILDEAAEGGWAPGGASRWWLHHSLVALQTSLRAAGSDLLLRRGDSLTELLALIKQSGASAVYWNRRYEPSIAPRDEKIRQALAERGVGSKTFNSALLFEPQSIQKKQGGPFQVFTPFWRQCLTQAVDEPVARPVKRLPAPAAWPISLTVDQLELRPRIRWDTGLAATWTPGETGAQEHLRQFTKRASAYAEDRDRPAADASSRLSPYLHFGELGPRQVWAAIKALSGESGVFPADAGAQKFLAELGWREFAYHLLHFFPTTPERPFRETFSRFPWAADPGERLLRAWQTGQTGYPLVDAGLRDLWKTGWMPNRVRMITSSFLVKHLRISWQDGAAFFWDTLVDADLANNTLGWQWIAGCGADAAPYFRIFAPVLQGSKFDPAGHYIRRWVPELARLPNALLQAPWLAPSDVLARAGVKLGTNYPAPIVDHRAARDAALAAYATLKK